MKLFHKKQKNQKEQEPFISRLSLDTPNWRHVFSACLGKMMAIQTACAELVVGGQDWQIDFEEGAISFGKKAYPLQFLGSEATSSNTWLWGWENINHFSEGILQLAQRTKAVGQRWQLEPLITAELPLDDTINGHNLAIVTCGLAQNYCYYRGPHAGGAIFVAFSGVPDTVFAPVDETKFISLTTQCMLDFPIDHKIFVEGFLLWNNTAYEWRGHDLTAHFGQDVTVTFEQAGDAWRIGGITSKPS